MVTQSGRVVALNTALLPGRYHEFGAVYDAVLGRELNRLGMHTELDARTNKLRLAAIPQWACDEFSKRSRDGETAARELARREGRDWETMGNAEKADLIKLETHRSRRDKESNTPDLEAWRRQAERIGWQHRSAVAHGPAAPARSYAERMGAAERVALGHLEQMLSKSAVLDQGDVRLAAARGFIAEGLDSTDDMDATMRRWAKATVMQDGQETRLAWRVVENGRIKLTTELHRAREGELVALARTAIEDRTHALSPGEVAAAVTRSGLVFRGEHGEAQRGAIEVLGTDGGLAVAVGVAGAGKSALLAPLVAAWQARGYTVWGAADANTQATKLTDAGIQYVHTRAVKPLLDSLNDGRAALDHDSVLVLDELGRIGTRELLDLLRHRERLGFKLVAVGDDRQCSAIEAGSVVDLLRQALGAERIPEILSTIRQQTEREREIARMFRNGEVAQAIAAKRADGTAELVEGGYQQAVERVADLWAERHRATQNRPDYRVTISAPTNQDAREIGRAMRVRRRALGEVTGPEHERRATDGRGDAYALALARGDDVRLFRRTRAVFTDEQGRRKSANIGDNGSVLRIEAVLPGEGLMLRAESGKVGFVSWRELEDRATGRTLLTWGSCLTIDSAQGLTSDEHINAMPSGSKAVTGRKAYVAASRHRVASYLVGSAGAELRQERGRRPRGVPEPATVEERQRAAWANLVRNLGQSGAKENATALLERSSETRRDTVKAFQAGLRRREAREAAGQKPVVLRQNQERRAVRAALPRLAEAVEQVGQEQAAVAATAAAMVRQVSATVRPMAPPARRARITEVEAQQQLYDAMRTHGLKPQGLPVMDGTLRYVPAEGNKGREKSGAYRAYYDDGWPSAAMWNWKRGGESGFVGTWTANAEAVPMSAAEQAVLARQQAQRAAARERDRLAREAAGAAKAAALWEAGRPATAAHPYLLAKGVEAHGIRETARGELLVPLRDADGRLRNVQTVAADGTKLYLAGARKVGTFHMLGELRPGAPVLVAEGYATAATVHEATGLPVAVALDTSNLKAVALALHEHDPARPIHFAADNDAHLPQRPVPLPNAGWEKARAAAAEVGGTVLLPDAVPQRLAAGKGTDWNDFAAHHGLDAASRMLTQQMLAVWQYAAPKGFCCKCCSELCRVAGSSNFRWRPGRAWQ